MGFNDPKGGLPGYFKINNFWVGVNTIDPITPYYGPDMPDERYNIRWYVETTLEIEDLHDRELFPTATSIYSFLNRVGVKYNG